MATWSLRASEVELAPFGRLDGTDAAALSADAADVIRFLAAAITSAPSRGARGVTRRFEEVRMADYTKLNLKADVKDMAPEFGLSPGLESRFARVPLELEQSGLSYFKLGPGFRTPFGHRHTEQEELYLVAGGSARVKLDDEVVELEQWDVVRIPAGTMRALEGGPDGAEVLAFSAPNNENEDLEMEQGWWE